MGKENQKMYHVHKIFGNRPALTEIAEVLEATTSTKTYGEVLEDAVIYLDGELKKHEAKKIARSESRIVLPGGRSK
jgi:hypothetical protein